MKENFVNCIISSSSSSSSVVMDYAVFVFF
jgi:hypothetical protein